MFLGSFEVDVMKKVALTVFEILEKAWALKNCTLVDMKVEFGVDDTGTSLIIFIPNFHE